MTQAPISNTALCATCVTSLFKTDVSLVGSSGEHAEKHDCASSDEEDTALPEELSEIIEGEAASLMNQLLTGSIDSDEEEEEEEEGEEEAETA